MAPHARDGQVESSSNEVHDNSWSKNLELSRHEDRSVLISEALEAIDRTAPDNHVNLVTHGDHGHPSTYLYDVLEEELEDETEWEFIDRCGCGGYVTRVHV